MTREEAIDKLNIVANYIGNPVRLEMIEAIKTLSCPWISVKNDLPCKHEELIIKSGTLAFQITKAVLVLYKTGEVRLRFMVKNEDKWDWHDPNILCWTLIPELPLPKE